MTRAVLLATCLAVTPAVAQVPDTVPPDSVPTVPAVPTVAEPGQDSAALPISPRGALIRSIVLPGWGQAEFESYFRGGIYFAGWAGNWFMNVRNSVRLTNARNRLDIRREQIETELIAASPNPDSLAARFDSFPFLLDEAVREDSLGNELRKLVSSRVQQREDWIAWSLFWLLASGIDAYVTAHLSAFPADVELSREVDGAVSLRVEVPWPRRPAPTPAALGSPPHPP